MIPLNAQSMESHNYSENPYNRQEPQSQETTFKQLELQELNRRVDLIIGQLTSNAEQEGAK